MRCSNRLLVLAVFLIFSVSSLPSVLASAEIVDQKQESATSEWQILNASPAGQEFIPGMLPLVAVDVNIRTLNPGFGNDTLTVRIRQSTISGTVLGSASQLVSDGFSGWVHFDLPSPIWVTLGSTYVVELAATKATFSWHRADSDLYPLGRAIFQGGYPETGDMDWAFRTYALSSAVGGSVVAIDWFEALAPLLGLLTLVIGTGILAIMKKESHST